MRQHAFLLRLAMINFYSVPFVQFSSRITILNAIAASINGTAITRNAVLADLSLYNKFINKLSFPEAENFPSAVFGMMNLFIYNLRIV